MTAIEQPSTQKWVGQALRRKEDPRMITGKGRYVDDMVVPGMLYMAVVRSPEAHAKITSIDASGAREQPGVFGVFTSEQRRILLAPHRSADHPLERRRLDGGQLPAPFAAASTAWTMLW